MSKIQDTRAESQVGWDAVMTDAEIIDAEVVETRPGTDVAIARPAGNLFAADPMESLEKSKQVAAALTDVLRSGGMIANIQRKEYVNVEGWQTLGSMVGVSGVVTHTEKLDNGFMATAEARTMDGRVIGRADALCTRDESQWSKRDDYALLGMAQTRAISRALRGPLGYVVKLAGFESTAAEEIPRDGGRGINHQQDEAEFVDDVLPPDTPFPATVHAARWWENPKTSASKLIVEAIVANINGGKPARETIWIDPMRREMTQLSSVCNDGNGIAPQSDVSHLVGRPLTLTVTLNGQYRNHTIGAPA